MIETVKQFVKQHDLCVDDSPIVVGVSGGADSVALLHLLHQWGLHLVALHCNFHLRGEESERDMLFVEKLCNNWEIPCFIRHFDTQLWAQKQGISIEMAARELRYTWFEEVRLHFNAQAIAVAHHQDDRKETILSNLLRGTGIRGLVALRPKQNHIIRPLLSVNKQAILDYCKVHSLPFIDDSTNFESICRRNRIRLELIPLMESIAQGAGDRLLRMADQLEFPLFLLEKEVDSLLDEWVVTTERYTRIPIEAFSCYPNPEAILYELLRPLSFKKADLDDIVRSFETAETKQFFSPTHRLVKERGVLYYTKLKELKTTSISIDRHCTSIKSPFTIHFDLSERDADYRFDSILSNRIYVDYDRLSFPLDLRRPLVGERFRPINMKGQKLVSDYLKDAKIPLLDRENVWILASGDAVVWVVGCRADDRFKVTKSTRRVLQIRIT